MCVVLVSIKILDLFIIFITAHSKAIFAIVVYAMGGISVRLSVTLRYYITTTERGRMQSLPPGSTVPLVFWRQEWLMGDDPVQIKVECKEVDPCENSGAVHISPHNSGTVIDSEAINQGRASLLTSPKMLFRCPNLSFFRRHFDKKHTSMLQSFILSTLPAVYL